MKNICTALKRIAIAATVYASLITGLCAQTPSPQSFTITSDTIWSDAPDEPIGNIIIQNGATLRMDGFTAYMDTSAVIVVGLNATLELYGTQLVPYQQNCFWRGVVLRNCDAFIMNESGIEFAKTGVQHVMGDCLIQIENSYFYNCAQGIELNGYHYNSNSYITSTVFEVGPIVSVQFNEFFSGIHFISHITADNSSIPVISGCDFLNTNNGIQGYNYAINAMESDVFVQGYNNTRSFFSGFVYAINTIDQFLCKLNVTDAFFKSNSTGIYANMVGLIDISDSEFALDEFDQTNFSYKEGINLNTCKLYEVYRNHIHEESNAMLAGSTGIYIKNTNGLNGNTSTLYENTITGVKTGIATFGNNLSNPLSGSTVGLEIKCNTIEDCSYGIFNDGQIGDPQGSPTASAGNVFNNNGRDIYSLPPNTFRYHYDGSAPSVYNVILLTSLDNGCHPLEIMPEDTLSMDRNRGIRSLYKSVGNERLEKLAEWHSARNDIESKYALIDVLKALGDYESAEFELRQILYSGKLTESGYSEYETYKELFYLEKTMREQGRDWKNMTADERTKLNRIAKNGNGRAQHTAVVISEFYKIFSPETKQTSFGPGDFPMTCYNKTSLSHNVCPVIYSDELKFIFDKYGSNICACSGDTIFVQGIYHPWTNEYPEDAPTWWYQRSYDGNFSFEIHYADSSMNTYDSYSGDEKCLTDKQCQDINLQITCESDFATGKHYASQCAKIIQNGVALYNNDTLSYYGINQIPALATSGHDHGEGTVTISWTGFDGTPRQHVLYFIIDDHFYIDYVGYGVEENEDVSANGVRVFPNPTNGTFTIEAEDITNVEIFDLAGQKLLTDNSGSQTINAGSLPTGVYLLKTETQNGTKYGKLYRK